MDFRRRYRLRLKLRSGQDSDVDGQWNRDRSQARALPENQPEPRGRQRQQRKFDQHCHCRRQRQNQQPAQIRRAPIFPRRVGKPESAESGRHVRVDQNAVALNGRLQRAARGKKEPDRFAEQLAAPMPEQENDQQREEQKRQARIEQQAARAYVRTIQNLRADHISVAILPTVGVARMRRAQQAGYPAANRTGERRRVRRLEHIFAQPVHVRRGEV